VWRGKVGYGGERSGRAWYGKDSHSLSFEAGRGTAWRGVVGRGKARFGKAWESFLQGQDLKNKKRK